MSHTSPLLIRKPNQNPLAAIELPLDLHTAATVEGRLELKSRLAVIPTLYFGSPDPPATPSRKDPP